MNTFQRYVSCLIFLSWLVLFPFSVQAQQQNIEPQLAAILALDDLKKQNQQLTLLFNHNELDVDQEITIYTTLAKNHHQIGELDKAIEQIELARQVAYQAKLPEKIAQTNKLLGIYNYFKGTFEQALSAYHNALDYYAQQDAPIKQANLLNNIGLVHSAAGNYPMALEVYKQAKPMYEQFGSQIDKIDIQSNIGGLYMHLGLYNKALEAFNSVYQKRLTIGDPYPIALTNSDLGISYVQISEYDKAEYYTREALKYYLENNLLYDAASEMFHLSQMLNRVGRYQEAMGYAQQCIDMKHDHMRANAGCYAELAIGNYYKGDIELTKHYLAKSNELAKEFDYKAQQVENLLFDSLLAANQGARAESIAKSIEFSQRNREISSSWVYQLLVKHEAGQLKQQVESLEQASKLHQLQLSKSRQQQLYSVIITILGFTVISIYYRRHNEKKIKNNLAKMVELRTSELKKLTTELKKANSVKSQFLANMSHEIRTPLTAILGLSQARANGEVTEENLTNDMHVIHRNSEHLLQLVNDILNLSKIEAGKFEIELADVNLLDCLKQVEHLFAKQAKRKGLTLKLEHNLPDSLYIKTDSLRLNQIIFNLCSNAIKFTDKGQVTISAKIEDDRLIIAVIDSGIGMDEEQLQHVFERFNQGNNNISRSYGGTGLGLFLSSQLARMLDGRINVDSQVNQGSTFVLNLPYIKGEKVDSALSQLAIPMIHLPKNGFSGKILLADDYQDNRELFARLFKHMGFEVLLAENGVQALAVYQSHKPDLILLDIQMPKLDGIETLKKLNQLQCQVPVYALTANAMPSEIREYMDQGFAGHIQKPLNRPELLSILTKHFNLHETIEQQSVAENNLAISRPELTREIDPPSHKPNNQPNSDQSRAQPPIETSTETSAINSAEASAVNSAVNSVDLSDLVELFKSELGKDLATIKIALNGQDHQTILSICHRISGAAAVFGFAELGTITSKIDMAGKREEFELLPDLVAEMAVEIKQIYQSA